MGSLLLNLDLNGKIRLGDKQSPSLETAELISTATKLQTKPELVEDWIDEWRKLFDKVLSPHGLSMGLGNKQVCIQRMQMFVNKVSDNKEKIFEATKAYLNDCVKHKRLGKLPQYFVLPQDAGPVHLRDIKTGELYDYYTNLINNVDMYKDISNYDV